jgi:hypothetical protein
MIENKKNEWAAAVASFFIAGCGQVYNGESWQKGVTFFLWRFIGVVFFFIYGLIQNWAINSPSESIAALWIPTRYIFFVFSILAIIPWILVALYDAKTAFSTARKMNAGEIPFKDNINLIFWIYTLVINILSVGFIVFVYFFFFGLA